MISLDHHRTKENIVNQNRFVILRNMGFSILGASLEQQNEIAKLAQKVGGYAELVKLPPVSGVAVYTIDPKTRQVKLLRYETS